jgi:imidazolonepropionase-like amidohydrolase
MLILNNCRLIPELTEGYEGDYDAPADVFLDGEKIAEIRPAGMDSGSEAGMTNPDADDTLDLGGMTLVPGFIEMHAHLYSFDFDENRIAAMSDGEILFRTYDFAREYLRAGYTTVRDCGSLLNAVSELKKAQSAGILTDLPRLLSCGDIITPTETGNDSFRRLYREADGADEMRKAGRLQFQRGNDFLKLMASGAFLNEGGDPGQLIVTDDEIRALVEVARMKGSYVCAHCHGAESIKSAIRCGVRTIEHGVFIDDEGISMLRDRTDCYLVPTGAITEYCIAHAGELSDNLREQTYAYYETERDNIRRAYEAGLKLGFGSDLDRAAFTEKKGFEFIARREYYGFSDRDILIQATRNSAEILGLDDSIGTVAAGKTADLVAVRGRPDEDIYALAETPALIIKAGDIVSFERST